MSNVIHLERGFRINAEAIAQKMLRMTMENLFDRELRDRHRKAKYALMMQLDWMSTTVTEQDEAIKQRLLKIMRILEGEE